MPLSDHVQEAEPQAEAVTEAETTEQASEEPSSDRPGWLPEKFTDPAAMANAYTELEKKLGTKEEDLKAALKEDLTKEIFEGRPETPGDYVIPDVISDDEAVDNELLSWWATTAHAKGLNQEDFEAAITKFHESIPQEEEIDVKAEIGKLGENATARMEAVELWAGKEFQGDERKAIDDLLSTAAGYQVMEKLMKGGPKPGQGDDEVAGSITSEKLREMQADPRYHDPTKRDLDFVRKVDEGYKKLYANG